MSSLLGKVGRGIGQEIALKLSAAGASVVVNDLDDAPAQETVDLIAHRGGRATAFAGDVTDVRFAEEYVATATTAFGGLDIIVNNAGYTWDGVIQKLGDEQWDAILDVHLKAPFRILRAAQPVIAHAAKSAHAAGEAVPCRKVVNISSVAGLNGNAGQANYAAAKAGVVGLTKTLAKEWGRYNVTVNTVAFGLIETRLTAQDASGDSHISIAGREVKVGLPPKSLESIQSSIALGRPGTPAEAAGAVYLLCTPEADYITAQTLVCSGGLTL
jgi:3-oxoacyl-[acyl-carrier protein] reductase